MKKIIVFSLVCFVLSGVCFGLQQNFENQKLRNEIVEIKYINANWAIGILRPYMSRSGKINEIPGTNKVIIEDVSEVVDKIMAILKDVDIRPSDLQFNVDLLLGTTDENSKSDLVKELKNDPVLKELQNLLKYKAFRTLDSSLLKVQDNSRSSHRIGGKGINLKLELNPRYIQNGNERGTFQVDLRLSQYQGFMPDGSERTLTLIDTNLTLESGEKTVVGISNLSYVPREAASEEEDTALILILSGKVLK
ncbi:MAG: hypothetical protein MUP98_02880 [Candidatus Aminicenantes bacterium]|nr:hypothetical protein [Candidatus Aminicenantes bacterium]